MPLLPPIDPKKAFDTKQIEATQLSGELKMMAGLRYQGQDGVAAPIETMKRVLKTIFYSHPRILTAEKMGQTAYWSLTFNIGTNGKNLLGVNDICGEM